MKVTFYSHNILYKYISIFAFKQVKMHPKAQAIHIEYLYDQSLPTWDYIDTKERKKLKMIALGIGSYEFEYRGVDFELEIKRFTDPVVLADEHGELTYELVMTVDDEHEQTLYDFIEDARETVQDEISLLGRNNKSTIRKYIYELDGRYGDWTILNICKKRDTSTLFLEPCVVDSLTSEVRRFVDPATRAEYEKYGIPYKFNVLLYGLPGTGKTTTIHCIASMIGSDIGILQLTKDIDDVNLTKAINAMSKLDNCKVLVLEDIDSIFSDQRKVHDSTKNSVTMSGILNFLDGLMRNEGILVFITTNNKDVLDEAVFRTGRIDLQFKYTHCKEDQLKQMIRYYFPEHEKELAKFYDKVQHLEFTIADLQTFFFKNRKNPLDILKNYKDLLLQKEDTNNHLYT
jgi:hypothetical protein